MNSTEEEQSQSQSWKIHNTTQILKQTTHLIYTHILTFLFLSTLILTFRSNVHSSSHFLSSFIDRNPPLLNFSPSPSPSPPQRNAFLHFSRLAPLDHDFLNDFDTSLSRSKHIIPNATLLGLSAFSERNLLGFDNVGFRFKLRNDDGNVTVLLQEKGSELLFLAGVLSVTYAFVVVSFIVTYTWVSGVVYVRVLDWFCEGNRTFLGVVWDGSSVGLKRVSGFVLMKWAVRDAMAQLMGIYYFGEVEDQYKFFKVFVGMKFMPFCNVTPWVKGYEWESAGFAVVWFLSDFVVGFLFAVDGWVAIADGRRGGKEIVKEGCHLLGTLFYTGFEMRWSEAIVCGSIGRWVMRRYVGEVFTFAFQSFMEVYFMVAWLIFYLAARHKDEASVGRTFGRRELEGLLAVAR